MRDPKSQVRTGVLWLGSASLVAQILDALGLIVVLMFLSREDMGVATLSWSVAVIVEALNGLGTGAALLQSKRVERADLDAVFSYAVGTALIFALIAALLSPFIAASYREPSLAPMLVVSVLKLPLVSAALVPLQMLNRELRFRDVALIQTASTILSLLLKIALAVFGLRAWALVIANTSYGLFTLIGAFILYPMLPRPTLDFARIRELIVYGLRLSVHSVLYHTMRNADFLIVGHVLGSGPLGLYRVAFDIAMTPPLAIQQTVSRTAFPVFSRLTDDPPLLAQTFTWMQRGLGLVAVPIALFLTFGAHDLLALVAEGRWVEAAPALIVLSWAAVPRTLAQLYPELYKAAGRPGLAVQGTLFTFALLVSGFAAGLYGFGQRFGVLPVAFTWLLGYPLILVVLLLLAQKVAPLRGRDYLSPFRHPLLAGLLATCLAAPLAWLRSLLGESVLLSLGHLVMLAGVILGAFFWYTRRVLHMSPKELLGGTKRPAATTEGT